MALKIYTKTGDKGETSLFGGKRVSKADVRVEAYGTVDELNAMIGLVVALEKERVKHTPVKKILLVVQHDLLDIGSSLAHPTVITLPHLTKRVEEMEKVIDEMTKQLPPLTNFILPGGTPVAASLHSARTICRRAERSIIELSKKETISLEVKQYFNRLSDLLFTMARYANFKENQQDSIWIKKG